MAVKSPFFIRQEFLSPLLCEEIVDSLELFHPDTDPDGFPIKTAKGHEVSEERVFERFKELIPTIEKYYNMHYRGTEPMLFEWYPQTCSGEKPHCENSGYVNRQWVRQKDRDFTCIIFFSQYQEQVPFDEEYEVKGGKLEFVQHQFGFNPERGTLIVFPSGPHFINNTALIQAGDLFQVRFHLATNPPYQYHPKLFPGDYTNWFRDIS